MLILVVEFFSLGAQWHKGRVHDSRPRGCGFVPHWRHCVVFLSKTHSSSLHVSTGSTQEDRPDITENFKLGRKESNQTKKFLANVISLTVLNQFGLSARCLRGTNFTVYN